MVYGSAAWFFSDSFVQTFHSNAWPGENDYHVSDSR